ncbi:DUF1749-domain-containing protein [Byssothecium circinans]|uniref:DUF1749-domain-containing protein n=1 Tax=Byssothecium circinans TaxID=147558 RepID=A0A6A5T794_9PLEO|nr:DUF1749-domain-containing protein [Byssothecium circinans]
MAPHAGTLHNYTKTLVAFEHSSPSTSTSTPSPPLNTLLWLGGLGDGLLTVSYPRAIATSLPPTWRIAEVLTSSSYRGWATGSLQQDAKQLGLCVEYFRSLRPGGKIVLMGHSTGCQDIMEYLVGTGAQQRAIVDGVVLQAGVSDREAWDGMGGADGGGTAVGRLFGHGVSAYRAWSLLCRGGDDDFFSSDLGDEVLGKTFGRVGGRTGRVMMVWGERDEYVPRGVDGGKLLSRWARVVREGGGSVDEVNGGIIEGASHNLNGDPEEVVRDLVGRVVRFLEGLGGESG